MSQRATHTRASSEFTLTGNDNNQSLSELLLTVRWYSQSRYVLHQMRPELLQVDIHKEQRRDGQKHVRPGRQSLWHHISDERRPQPHRCESLKTCIFIQIWITHSPIALPGQSFMKLNICVFFENISRKCKFRLNLTRITGTLHEDLCIFMIISRRILLRVRNVSEKSCRENQNTFYVQ
jgi:hypothetical protein